MYAQIALFVHAYAVWSVWRRTDTVTPVAVAGHSLGEFTAWVVSGTLEFTEGLRLVKRRAELMEDACRARPGAMAALLGLDAAQVHALCEATRGIVHPANFNAPGQIVVSGELEAVQAVVGAASTARGKARVLHVAGGFHSPLMAEAAQRFAAAVHAAFLRDPALPVIANATAEVVTTADGVRAAMHAQMLSPVRWEESLHRMWALGARTFVEVGAGTVLTGLVRRTLPEAELRTVGDAALLAEVVEA